MTLQQALSLGILAMCVWAIVIIELSGEPE